MKANTNNQTKYVFVDCCMSEMGAFDIVLSAKIDTTLLVGHFTAIFGHFLPILH